ncbi:MAG: methyltransferase [Lactobacillus sp.]|nr:methyltransferase [Lactobacillus sp.]
MMDKTEEMIFAEEQLRKSQEGEFPRYFDFMGRSFILNKDVFSPEVFLGYRVYVPHLPLSKGQTLLDMGCGSGVIGITCCLEYDLSYVLCADISDDAVLNTYENIHDYYLSGEVEVLQSDVYSNIGNERKFDLIFWNFPYFDFEPKNPTKLEMCTYDPGYNKTKEFIVGGFERIAPQGKIMLGFSSTRFPLEHAKRKVQEIGFDLQVFFQDIDANGISQELLEVVRL